MRYALSIMERHSYNIEDVFAANPGPAAHGPVLPSGLLITPPAIEAETPKTATTRLWNGDHYT